MDGQSNHFELPNPQALDHEKPVGSDDISKEAMPARQEVEKQAGSGASSVSAPVALPTIPMNDSGTQVTLAQGGAVSTSISDDTNADDVDLIEKVWVEKAKAIINKTRDDPYSQNKELNKVKAQYIKRRYNKDLKLSE